MADEIREVHLTDYLPNYLKGYTEIAQTLIAEDPEFKLLWEACNRLLQNAFTATADEYGISRREKLVGALPSALDTLESRRSRVQALWWNQTPYSIRAFVKKLAELCGGNNFEVDKTRLEEYYLGIITHLNQYGQLESLNRIVTGMTPQNVVIDVLNEIITVTVAAVVYAGTIATVGAKEQIDNDVHSDNEIYINPKALIAAVAEVYEDCEGTFGIVKDRPLSGQPLGCGTAITGGIESVLSEGGNRDVSLSTETLQTGSVIAYSLFSTLQLTE